MGAPYDNIPGVDSSDNFHPDIREALLASEQFVDLKSGRLAPTATQTTDWNTTTKNGWYYSGPGAANSPSASYVIGQVIATPSAVTQEVFEYTLDGSGDTRAYRRDYQGSAWVAWYRIRISEAEMDARYWQTAVTELGTEDLNTIVTPGEYHQSQNADAAAATNYPRPDAGYLSVRAGGTNFVYQEYSTYQASAFKYWRAKYNSNWSAWKEVQSVIPAGTTAQYFRGDKTWQTLNSTAVGLGNVTNTADTAKPFVGWGTAAQRDAHHGVPSTTADKVTLANKKVVWYNTATGQFQQYYATTGSAGLTVTGIAGASGWYQELSTINSKVILSTPANYTLIDELSVTRVGSIVTFRGRMNRNAAVNAVGNAGHIPVGYRPTSAAVFPSWWVNGNVALGQINPDGSTSTPFSTVTGDFMCTGTWPTDPTIPPF